MSCHPSGGVPNCHFCAFVQTKLCTKTREEVARDYVTRNAHNVEYSRLMDKIDKLDAKIDKLITD